MAAMQTPKPEPQTGADVREILDRIKQRIASISDQVDNIQNQSGGNKELHILDAKIQAYIDGYRDPYNQIYPLKTFKAGDDTFLYFRRVFDFGAEQHEKAEKLEKRNEELEAENFQVKYENEDLKNRLLGLKKKEDKTE
jgi:hypothetical protein